MFKSVDPKPNFVELEHRILDFWRENDILGKYLHRNDTSQKKFSFLDGPITANNPMGVHHAWGRTLKDLYQRYKNMRGFRQRFQNGFDCQGLWVEVEVEKKLGFKSKKDIERYGIAAFVEKCKEHTLEFAQFQIEQSKRLGYFMDWGNDYFTMSDENNYAIWHFLKKVAQDGNLYKGRDSVPWCPRCGTAISQHEILTEEYRELTHEAVFLKFPIEVQPAGRLDLPEGPTSFLVWTTTPWTIPGNVALAVNPEVTYVEVKLKTAKEQDNTCHSELVSESQILNQVQDDGSGPFILAKSRLLVIDEPYEIVREFNGSELEGLKYEGPFDGLERVREAREENPETFHSVVLSKGLVFEEEGTGIVHIAPGAGTEDFRLGKEKSLPVIEVIDEAANYLDGFGEFSGQNAKEHPELILDYLEGSAGKTSAGKTRPIPQPSRLDPGKPRRFSSGGSGNAAVGESVSPEPASSRFLYKIEPYTHRYPVCWRCQTELVWRVVDEWYIAMDDERCPNAKNYRQQLQEVIKEVRWIPSFGYDRELDWLRNMEDWLISKKRYWGLALPIWECPCGRFEVIGSKEELKERTVEGWEEFESYTPHRPWVDKVKIKCPECGELVSRIPDVGNPWLDAGIVSFSTLKYFEDHKYWKEWFPADLVLEALPGQFKNWFYSLLAMSTVLEDRAPFKTLFGHALVMDEQGEEMHKSKGNAIWFDDAAEKMGVDVMRWLYVTQDSTRDLWFGYSPADEVRRRFFLILWNSYKFFVTYAELDGFDPSQNYSESDFTVLDRWILSRLNNLVKEVTSDLDDYRNPLAARVIEDFVINDLSTWYIRRSRSRVGPTAPDGEDKETVHQTLHSVLLTLSKLLAPSTPFLAEEMYQNLAAGQLDSRAARQQKPNSRHSELDSESDGNSEERQILKQVQDDANGKPSVHLEDWPEADENLIDEELEKKMELVREICEKGHAARREAGIKVRQPISKLTVMVPKNVVAHFSARSEEREINFAITNLIKDELNVKEVLFEEGKELEVELDTKVTLELKLEGLAREMVRGIQDARKEAGCNLNDHIVATFPDSEENKEAARKFEEYIKRETLSVELKPGKEFEVKVAGQKLT